MSAQPSPRVQRQTPTWAKVTLAVINSILIGGYPVLVYVGLTRWGPRSLAVLLVACIVPGLLIRLWTTAREHLWPVLRIPLTILATLAVGAAIDDARVLLVMPVLINAVLLANFAGSLRGEVSIVERFARIQDPELPPGGPAYCRKVTWVWCGFFVINGTVAGVLALAAPIAWWALYTGALAYILIGVLFTAEFIVRKAIFRRFGSSVPDRIVARILGETIPVERSQPAAKPTEPVS